MKLFDSELKVMEVLWERGATPAGEISAVLKERTGWNRNTTYTIIKKCIEKGAIRRQDPKFLCIPLVTREDVQQHETEELIDRMFGGSKAKFFAAMLEGDALSQAELEELRSLIARKDV